MSGEQHRPALRNLLEEVNDRINEAAAGQDGDGEAWEFFCECGRPDCREQVVLSLREFDALKQAGQPVIASGHLPLRPRKARERARELAEESEALRAQARQQVSRARRNHADGRWRVAGSRTVAGGGGAGYSFELVREDTEAERVLEVEIVGGGAVPRGTIDDLVRSCLAQDEPPRRVVVDGLGRLIRTEPGA